MQTSPLTTLPGLESAATFSPDGNQVAFVWDGEKGDNEDIYVTADRCRAPASPDHQSRIGQKPCLVTRRSLHRVHSGFRR